AHQAEPFLVPHRHFELLLCPGGLALRHVPTWPPAATGLGQCEYHGPGRWDDGAFWRLPAQPPQYERDYDDRPWRHWRSAQHRGSPDLATGWCEGARADCAAFAHDAGGHHRHHHRLCGDQFHRTTCQNLRSSSHPLQSRQDTLWAREDALALALAPWAP